MEIRHVYTTTGPSPQRLSHLKLNSVREFLNYWYSHTLKSLGGNKNTKHKISCLFLAYSLLTKLSEKIYFRLQNSLVGVGFYKCHTVQLQDGSLRCRPVDLRTLPQLVHRQEPPVEARNERLPPPFWLKNVPRTENINVTEIYRKIGLGLAIVHKDSTGTVRLLDILLFTIHDVSQHYAFIWKDRVTSYPIKKVVLMMSVTNLQCNWNNNTLIQTGQH